MKKKTEKDKMSGFRDSAMIFLPFARSEEVSPSQLKHNLPVLLYSGIFRGKFSDKASKIWAMKTLKYRRTVLSFM